MKGRDEWRQWTKGKYDTAIDALFAGTKKTYDDTVIHAKAALPPGEKLSIQQKKEYQQQALTNAATIAQAQGVDLFKVMTEDQAKVWVEKAVQSLKGKVQVKATA